jgi:hypothetical protein
LLPERFGEPQEPAGVVQRKCQEEDQSMNTKALALSGLMMSLSVCGCRVSSQKDGDNERVSVATPFGGVKVKTNDATGIEGIGIPVYPGSELVKKKDKDNGSADVNLSFGKFQLRVKAASYRTPDGPDKVKTFYMDAMKRYGTVIQCSHDQPIAEPTRTEEGLTCSEDGKHGQVKETDSAKIELKAGSKQHQHIVAVEPEGSGTKFGLVALDLPIGFDSKENSDDTRQ